MPLFLIKTVELLSSPISIFFVSVLILALVIYATYKISRFLGKWEVKEAQLDTLWESWSRDIPYIKNQVNALFQHFIQKSPVITESPARLSETGKEIAKAINAERILNKNKEFFKNLINASPPNNAYDLQQIYFRVVEEQLQGLLDDKELQTAKKESLKHGIPLENSLSIIAVLLRDCLVKEYGWTDIDIDKHAT